MTPIHDTAEETEMDIKELCFSAANSARSLTLLPSEVLELIDRLEAAEKERNALRAENETLAANLRGKHSTAGATYAHLIAERDSLRAQIDEMKKHGG